MPEKIPPIGFGTYKLEDETECIESVKTALDVGYRHIDTAQVYENEAYVGEGIAESNVDREDIFLATKVGTKNLSYDDVLATTAESLDKLGVDVVDLLYIHWPINAYDAEETLAAFDQLSDDGKIRHVGVSNFLPAQLAEAREVLEAPLFAHQVEMHPLLQQRELHREAVEHDEYLIAYSPLARNEVADVSELRAVAEKHDATPAQISLAWLANLENVVPIPKASSEAHIRENLAAMSIELDDEDHERIRSIDREKRLVDFEEAPWNQ